MEPFAVGLSSKLWNADGTRSIPEFDLAPLYSDPRIECSALPEGPDLSGEELEHLDAVVLFLERITSRSFEPRGRLALIARYGVGYDQIDVSACTEAGVALAITPDGVRRPVAASVMALMLALTMRLMVKDRIARQGPPGWAIKTDYNGIGLTGRTLGALGVGNIGAEVFRLARPFDMVHIAHDPYADVGLAREIGVELVDIATLFARADVLTVHCPLSEVTRGLVSEPLLRSMKPKAYVINTARGPIVDQEALTRVLQEGIIAGAGLDVLECEPPNADDPLLAMDNVILAPHALCFTDECLAGIGAADVRAIQAVLGGAAPGHVVNREVLGRPDFIARLAGYAERFATPSGG